MGDELEKIAKGIVENPTHYSEREVVMAQGILDLLTKAGKVAKWLKTARASSRELRSALVAYDRLNEDLRDASALLSTSEVRYLVDAYYTMQDQRIRANNQAIALTKSKEPHGIVRWLEVQSSGLEQEVHDALEVYAKASPVGQWAMSQVGIGPVFTAGLLAHIDIEKAKTVGSIWRFGGLDPTSKWNKGEKRPWNARLKRLCWLIGESFKKFSNHPHCIYGHLYRSRKEQETERNEAGLFADQAAATLVARPTHKQREIYASGKLPIGRLDLRAMRYATKLFLAHLHEVMYWDRYGTPPPKPYVLAHLGHAHYLAPPGWPLEKQAASSESADVGERADADESTESRERTVGSEGAEQQE